MNSSDSKDRVFIVEDHPVALEGLVLSIEEADDYVLHGTARTAEEALEVMSEDLPDVAIVDLHLPDKNGLTLIGDIHDDYPDVSILVVSAYPDAVYAQRALHAGALGYINKAQAIQNIIEGLRHVAAGELYISEDVSQRISREKDGPESDIVGTPEDLLTDRELEVFKLIGRGYSNSEIGEKLEISVKTVETYRERMKKKLPLKNARELLRCAIRWIVSESGF